MLLLSEQINVLSLIRKEKKKSYAEVKTDSKNNPFTGEMVKKEKETRASLAVTFQTAKIKVTVPEKCFVKMAKA